ncbi:hypothetical protein [Microbacterium sp. BH-3-3-3]|uniref:hypothetical protein n=1 Tax=Microbacterium sp. BH-3-3-3 TaxID=1906742 RepID=UPI0021B5739C|nr:hypothetical protein [Microbacterium sp. BH-3-3-3]
MAERALPDGRSVVVVEVKEFDLVPVLSKRAHQQNIHVGRLYTRSMAKAETSPQQTPNELRELLQLAVEKGVRAYLQTARNVGFGAALDAPPPFGTERDTYLQRADSQAYIDCPRLMAWVHPVHYRPDQIEYESLQATLNGSAVSADATLPDLRSVERGATYLFGNTHGPALQTWALFQSGQFLLVRPLPTRFGPDPGGVGAGEGGTHYLPLSLPVHFITDVAHFAARLQQRVAPDQPFSVSVSLVDAQGWQLTARKLGRPFLHEYAMADDNWTQTEILPPYFDEGQHKPVAAELARQLFQRFGWKNASKEVVASVQDSLLDRY